MVSLWRSSQAGGGGDGYHREWMLVDGKKEGKVTAEREATGGVMWKIAALLVRGGEGEGVGRKGEEARLDVLFG